MHDSGFDNYSFAVTGVVIAPDKSIALLLPEAGRVEGTASWERGTTAAAIRLADRCPPSTSSGAGIGALVA